jgi:hypothetical protein
MSQQEKEKFLSALQPPKTKENNKNTSHPEWVTKLNDFFVVVGEPKFCEKDKRMKYEMECRLCNEKNNSAEVEIMEPTQRKKKKVENKVYKGRGACDFEKHLTVISSSFFHCFNSPTRWGVKNCIKKFISFILLNCYRGVTLQLK